MTRSHHQADRWSECEPAGAPGRTEPDAAQAGTGGEESSRAEREERAQSRDLAAAARDEFAAARDLAMAQCDDDAHGDGEAALTHAEMVARAAAQRERAARHSAHAAADRARAAEDRQAAAEDRRHAAADLQGALADQAKLARELAITETDSLTGARTRAAGLTDLDHELHRCRRTKSRLVVAYVDVVGLKSVNDIQGHQAGDRLLVHSVAAIKQHLRPYDLVIRLGGDEFLCVMSSMTLLDAHRRFSAIAVALADAPSAPAIRTGFAELSPEQTATDLIATADADLIDSRYPDRHS